MAARPYGGPGPRPYSPRAPNLVWNNVHRPPPPPNQQSWNKPNFGGPRGGCPPFQTNGPRWPPPRNSGPFQQNNNNFHGSQAPGGNTFYGNRCPGPNYFRHNGPMNTNNQNFQNPDCSQSNFMDDTWQSPNQNTDNSHSGAGGFNPGYRGNGRGGFQRGRGRGRGQHHQFNQGKQKKKKELKPDKRDLPENNKFYCDTCDRGFPTEDKFQEHNDQHQQCTYAGCSYIAAPKLVQLHIQLQHKSGLAKKVWSLESQEDINKWREERKKNFPTTANIEKKKALLEERKCRGEVLQNKYFGKMKGRDYNKQNIDLNNDEKGTRKRNQSAGEEEVPDVKKKKLESCDQTSDEENSGTDSKSMPCVGYGDKVFMTPEIKKAIKARNRARAKAKKTDKEEHWSAFRTIRNKVNKMIVDKKEELGIETCRVRRRERDAANKSSDSIDDESKGGENAGECNEEKSLIEENDQDDIEGPEEKSILREIVQDLKSAEEVSKFVDLTEEEPTNGHTEVAMDKRKNSRTRNKRSRKQEPKSNIPTKKRNTSSLLEKLLANDIRHERNVILQCVHYVVKNNFFGVGQLTGDQSPTKKNNGHLSCDSVMNNGKSGQSSCDDSLTNGINVKLHETCDISSTNDKCGQSPCDSLLTNDSHSSIAVRKMAEEVSDSGCDTESSNDIGVDENKDNGL